MDKKLCFTWLSSTKELPALTWKIFCLDFFSLSLVSATVYILLKFKKIRNKEKYYTRSKEFTRKKIFVPKGYYSCFSQDLFLAIIRHLCLPVSHDSFLKVLNNITHHELDHVQCKYIQVSLLCKTMKNNFGPTFDRQKCGRPKKS